MDVYECIEKGKINRYLSARNRIIYSGGVYHITHRAPGRELLFVENGDYLRMVFLLKEISRQFMWDVFSFVFMSNHLHILLRITDVNLSQGMKNLCERYAKFFNAKYERKGPVFSRPYRAALCLDDNYLLSISTYIHLNPFKAGICKSVDGYRWSSLGLYINKNNSEDSFVNSRFVLNILDEDITKARDKYKRLISESASIEFKNIIEMPSYIDHFKNELRFFLKEIGIVKEDIIEKELDMVKDKIKQKGPKAMLAKKYLVEQLLARGYKSIEIANRLNITRKTVYNILNYTKRASLKMGK